MARPGEIRAVRKVLYQRDRLIKLKDDLVSIDVLMNLNDAIPLAPGDVRVFAGSGPNWFIADTGEIAVGEAAARCARIASTLLEIRRELAGVKFNASDKQHLRAALAERAEACRARGKAWRAPGRPDVEAVVASIETHMRASAREFERVKDYLRPVDLNRLP